MAGRLEGPASRPRGGKASFDPGFAPGRRVEESCRIVATDGFYPSEHKLDEAYAQRWDATLVRQMAAAGRQLAGVLHQSLSSR